MVRAVAQRHYTNYTYRITTVFKITLGQKYFTVTILILLSSFFENDTPKIIYMLVLKLHSAKNILQ